MPSSNLGNIAVTIGLNDQTSPELRRVEQSIRSFQSTSSNAADPLNYSMQRARESARLASEEIGVHMPRALARVLAESTVLGPALAAAFSGIALVGFIQVLSQVPTAIKKIADLMGGWDDALKGGVKSTSDLNKSLEEEAKKQRA